MLIKLCGVKDPEIASFAAENGAHFIGFILTPGLRRSVPIDRAQMIVQAARKAGAEPVAVFVNAFSEDIESTCQLLDVHRVQAYQLMTPLSPNLQRIYVNAPEAVLRPGLDALLMESEFPGQGVQIDRETLMPFKQRPLFIAGGLTPENVKATIEKWHPDGVDVSSGVEENGNKSPKLILKFIEQVKSCE